MEWDNWGTVSYTAMKLILMVALVCFWLVTNLIEIFMNCEQRFLVIRKNYFDLVWYAHILCSNEGCEMYKMDKQTNIQTKQTTNKYPNIPTTKRYLKTRAGDRDWNKKCEQQNVFPNWLYSLIFAFICLWVSFSHNSNIHRNETIPHTTLVTFTRFFNWIGW